MLNRVVIQGRIGSDIELATTASGTAVTTINVAVDRDFKTDSGNRETDWFSVVFWGSRAEFLQKYFTKGAQIIIEGRLQTRRWEDRDGTKRSRVEIVAENTYFAGNSNRRNESAGDGNADFTDAGEDLDNFFG